MGEGRGNAGAVRRLEPCPLRMDRRDGSSRALRSWAMLDLICERHLAIDRLAERDFGRLGLSRTRERAPLRGRQRRSLRTALAQHGIKPAGGESWELHQRFSDERQIAVDLGRSPRPVDIGQAGLADHPQYRVAVHTKLGGDSSASLKQGHVTFDENELSHSCADGGKAAIWIPCSRL